MNDKPKATGAVHDMIQGLSSTPLILGLLLFNLIWLGAVGLFAGKSSERWEAVVQTVLKSCGPQKEGKLGRYTVQSETSEPYPLLGKAPEDGIPFELQPIPYPDL